LSVNTMGQRRPLWLWIAGLGRSVGKPTAPDTMILRYVAAFGPASVRDAQVWSGLPLFARPCVYVFYRYILRFGFLDGKQGFVFHVLQGFWYRLLVDINIDELRQAGR